LNTDADDDGQDVLAKVEARAIAVVCEDSDVRARLDGEGVPWGILNKIIKERALPSTMDDAYRVAYNLVPKVLDAIYGPQNQRWHSFKRDGKTWVKSGTRLS